MNKLMIGLSLCLGLSACSQAGVLTCVSTYKIDGNPLSGQVDTLATATGVSKLIVEQQRDYSILFTANTDFGTYTCHVTKTDSTGTGGYIGTTPTCAIAVEPAKVIVHMKHAPKDTVGIMMGNCR